MRWKEEGVEKAKGREEEGRHKRKRRKKMD